MSPREDGLVTGPELLLSGGFDPAGAYGPTIVMQLTSESAAVWLRDLFLEIAEGRPPMQLAAQPGVLLRDVGGVELSLETAHIGHELAKIAEGPGFAWRCSSERWRWNAGLLEPFVAGQAGHQYLTSEQTDDALVEVSFGEVHPGL